MNYDNTYKKLICFLLNLRLKKTEPPTRGWNSVGLGIWRVFIFAWETELGLLKISESVCSFIFWTHTRNKFTFHLWKRFAHRWNLAARRWGEAMRVKQWIITSDVVKFGEFTRTQKKMKKHWGKLKATACFVERWKKKKHISTKEVKKSRKGRHSGRRRGSGGCLVAAPLLPTVPAIT